MELLTNKQYRERGECNPIGTTGTFSYLTLAELSELKMCIAKERPVEHRAKTYITLAAKPQAAVHYVNKVLAGVSMGNLT
mgnify:CR=1 FL=1